MKKYLPLLFLPLLLNSCKNNTDLSAETETEIAAKSFEKINQLQWLLGTWTNETDDEFSQETWSRENDSTFTGYSFVEIDGKVVFAETMALELKADNILLTVASAKDKGKKPVAFKMIALEKGQIAFENKNHDFPQRIIYTNPAKDSLHAWIEGVSNGETKKVDFYFSKK